MQKLLFAIPMLALLMLSGCNQVSVSEAPASVSMVSSHISSSSSSTQSSALVVTSAVSSSAAPESEIPVVSEPVAEEENLLEKVWISFEKPVYGAETSWLYIWVNNKSSQPVYLMRTFQTEQLDGDSWIPIGGERELENPNLQFPVEPGESRLVGIYMGWMRQPNERYGDNRIPAGSYRIQVCLNRGVWFEVPFAIQEDPLEQDTTSFEIRTLEKTYSSSSDRIDYEVINKTQNEISFGYACLLEKWDGEVWKRYPVSGYGMYPEVAISLRPGETVRESFSLAGLEEPLEAGRYRLVKTLVRNTYYAEFEVPSILVKSVEKEVSE